MMKRRTFLKGLIIAPFVTVGAMMRRPDDGPQIGQWKPGTKVYEDGIFEMLPGHMMNYVRIGNMIHISGTTYIKPDTSPVIKGLPFVKS